MALDGLIRFDHNWDSRNQTKEGQPPAPMMPVTFGGCFGWFHPAAQPSSLAVLLCPPLGREARWVHRSLRKLATRLAEAGIPSLRFDYPNSGDSCDWATEEEPLAAWQESVHMAADWLRGHSGAPHLAMLGIRFGAMMAARAAADRSDTAALVLMAPVVSGRSYLRELTMMARVAQAANSETEQIEVDGLGLTDATLQALGALAMPAAPPPAQHVLILEQGHAATLYANKLTSEGADVTCVPFEGYAGLMESAVTNRVPEHDLQQIVVWLRGLSVSHSLQRPEPQSQKATMETGLRPAGCFERPFQFGADQHLFGMLCQPDGEKTSDMVVVIGNSGGDPHTGIGRFAVLLARRLAAHGIASLRMDFAGLGDSVLGHDDRDGHVYAINRNADLRDAIDTLAALGYRRFATTGLCTGAYHALAATIVDKRIGALAMINLATFLWRENDVVEIPLENQLRSSASYREGLKRWDSWSRMIRGQIDMRSILFVIGQRSMRRVTTLGLRAAERVGLVIQPPQANPRLTMRKLSERGTKTLLLLAFDDPGIDILEQNFGRGGRNLAVMPGANVVIKRDLDHTLSTPRMRDSAIATLIDFFRDVATSEQRPSTGP